MVIGFLKQDQDGRKADNDRTAEKSSSDKQTILDRQGKEQKNMDREKVQSMKTYMIWDDGRIVGIMELEPEEAEMLIKGGLEVYEAKQAKRKEK